MQLKNDEVRIENASTCNAKCTICPRDKMTRPQVTMDTSHFIDLVDQVLGMGAKTISIFWYGEPLLDFELESKIHHCTSVGLDTFITTNASLLNTNRAYGLLNAGLSHIRFSAHGTFDYYNKVHIGLSFMSVMRNIDNFIQANKVRYGNQCRVEVTTIPMNGQPQEDIINFWKGRVDEIQMWRPHNWANAMPFRKGERKLKTCGRPFNGPLQINADGTVMVCCMDSNGELTVGDTHKESIEDILKGERFTEIRRKHDSGDLSGLICQDCDQLYIEEEAPLLYTSNGMEINRTSSTKFKLQAEEL